MNMLIDEMQMLASTPGTWIVVACMAFFAVHSFVAMTRCPYVNGRVKVTPDAIDSARQQQFLVGSRFALAMVTGIALMISGTFMIAYGIKTTVALALLVIGVVIVQTEPARLRIREGSNLVVSAHGQGQEAILVARHRLAGHHRHLVTVNVAMLVCLIVALLAF